MIKDNLKQQPTLLLIKLENTKQEKYVKVNNVTPLHAILEDDFDIHVKEAQSQLDMDALLQQQNPDLIMYDLSSYVASNQNDPILLNALAKPSIPRVALMIDDAHAQDKPYKFQYSQKLGVEAVFCVDSAMRTYTNGYRDLVYLMPWYVNSKLYRNYNLEKDIPIGLFGYGFKDDPTDNRYPWRREMILELTGELPFLTYPRPDHKTPHNLVGESYARMLNRCHMAFSCGGVRSVFVKKMLEIPACNTCLVVEDSPVVREMGFIDEINCLMVDKSNVVDKCRHYLDNPNELQLITDKGHQHVLNNHSLETRKQVVEWYTLRKQQQVHQHIQQNSALKPLQLITGDGKPERIDRSCFYDEMQAGIQQLKTGRYSNAAQHIGKIQGFLKYSAETRYYTTILGLCNGDKKAIKKGLKHYKQFIKGPASNIDPSIFAIVCLGLYLVNDNKNLKAYFDSAPRMKHPFWDSVIAKLKLNYEPGEELTTVESIFEFPGKDLYQIQRFIGSVTKHRRSIKRFWN